MKLRSPAAGRHSVNGWVSPYCRRSLLHAGVREMWESSVSSGDSQAGFFKWISHLAALSSLHRGNRWGVDIISSHVHLHTLCYPGATHWHCKDTHYQKKYSRKILIVKIDQVVNTAQVWVRWNWKRRTSYWLAYCPVIKTSLRWPTGACVLAHLGGFLQKCLGL